MSEFDHTEGRNLEAMADELVMFEGSALVGDTFVFEPAVAEASLGMLFAVAETEGREGVGRELMDTVIQAIQREYYRDPKRGVLASFESALHQANLMLHDLVEQGVREWIGCWHVAVGVLADNGLHVSTAGEGVVVLARAGKVTVVSTGLSHSPITDPLRTFSQVASGVMLDRDVLFFGSSHFEAVFRHSDLTRFVIEPVAELIGLRMRQLYDDQRQRSPVAALVLALQAIDVSPRKNESDRLREPISTSPRLTPRKPLKLKQSMVNRIFLLIGRFFLMVGQSIKQHVWPLMKEGGRKGGKIVVSASTKAGRNVQSLAERRRRSNVTMEGAVPQTLGDKLAMRKVSILPMQSWMRQIGSRLMNIVRSLPITSKVFGVAAIVLAVSLLASLVLLQSKRTADQEFQQVSEQLHEARTKREAAETALIYDNRDQARQLLGEARDVAGQVAASGLYEEEVAELERGIEEIQDRLAKVTRVMPEAWRTIGDFDGELTSDAGARIFYVNDFLYAYNGKTNDIVKMGLEGEIEVVNSVTKGVGFFGEGIEHMADKSLVLATSDPGIAVFDTVNNLLQKQEVSYESAEPEIVALATFGNRLYVYDRGGENVFSYNKSLRGYSGATAWIVDVDFPKSEIIDIGVDGFIYTLMQDGDIKKLFKGNEVDDFKLEKIDITLSDQARLIVNENLRYLYVFDPAAKRVVVFDKQGSLVRQIFLGDEDVITDMAVPPKEEVLYVLKGTTVTELSLVE